MEREIVVELFTIIDASVKHLMNDQKVSYLNALFMQSRNILDGTIQQKVSPDTLETLESLLEEIQEYEFSREDIRKALVVATLRGYKEDGVSNSEITPDTICLLMGYIAKHLLKDKEGVAILDPVTGSSNLLTSVLNTLNIEDVDIYGIDSNMDNIQLSRVFLDMQGYEGNLLLEDSVKSGIKGFDFILGDLPLYLYDDEYFPQLIVDKMIDKIVPGGYLLFVIPNDFFDVEGKYKDNITEKAHLEGLIKLPDDMFVESKLRKSILLLRRKKENDSKKEFLLVDLPSLSDEAGFRSSIKRIDSWFEKERE